MGFRRGFATVTTGRGGGPEACSLPQAASSSRPASFTHVDRMPDLVSAPGPPLGRHDANCHETKQDITKFFLPRPTTTRSFDPFCDGRKNTGNKRPTPIYLEIKKLGCQDTDDQNMSNQDMNTDASRTADLQAVLVAGRQVHAAMDRLDGLMSDALGVNRSDLRCLFHLIKH